MDKRYTLSQEQAIAWNNGAMLVLAGPGSGKTAVLTQRIARILSDSLDEEFKILALTFTNKAALEMSERILKIVPDAKGRLFVGTFHSFCAEVLRNHGSYVGIKPDFNIFSDENDLKAIVTELQDEYFEKFNDDRVYNLKILNAIKFFQEQLCYNDEQIDSNMPQTEYAAIFKWMYNRYIEKLLELNSLDFNSIVLFAYQLFSTKPMISKLYKSSYRYVCIDEFQDTNVAQYSLIKSFVPTNNGNLFIVADDDQVIYGWNGASNKRIIEFKNDYGAQIVQLSENFRCPSGVVHLANSLIAHNSGRVENKAPLIAMKPEEGEHNVVSVCCFKSENDELDYLCQEIMNIRMSSLEASIGVIARNNRLLQKAYNALQRKNIPSSRPKRKDDFENQYIRLIHSCLKLANRRIDKRIFLEVIDGIDSTLNINLNPNEIVVISKTQGEDYFAGLCSFVKKTNIESTFLDILISWLFEKSNYQIFIKEAFICLEKILNKSVADLDQQHKEALVGEYESEKTVWNSIVQQISNNYNTDIPLSTFLQEFSMTSKEPEPKDTDVQCLTIHASKGKEFDHVFLIGVVEDELPSFQSIKNGDNSIEMEEERRNCFVAITRTKKELHISYSSKYNGWNKRPSRFISEMGITDSDIRVIQC